MTRRGPRAAKDPYADLAHPHAGVRWFEALPAERRAEMERAHREELRRDAQLLRRSRRGLARELLHTALVFLVADQLLAPHASATSGLAAIASGAALGGLFVALHADRVLSGALGLAVFFVLQCLTRGGLTALHLFVFMPVGAACIYLGWRREEREYDP